MCANILHREGHADAIFILKTKFIGYYDNCLGSQFTGKVPRAARPVTPSLGAVDRLGIDVRRDDPETKRRKSRSKNAPPDNRQGIRLFSTGTASAPAAYFAFPTRDRTLRQLRQDFMFHMLKYAAVAIEPGNVNPTQALQRCPLVRMIFEVNSICFYTR
jgi:hypothetical protein